MKNPITPQELRALLNDEKTAAEALNFYFEYVSTGPFTGEYQLKSHIQIVDDPVPTPVITRSSSRAPTPAPAAPRTPAVPRSVNAPVAPRSARAPAPVPPLPPPTMGVVKTASLDFIKNILLNDANSMAKKKRDELFLKRKKDANRKIIVAEGDSWFQYPKYKKMGITLSKEVKDIIDYLIDEPAYNIKSLDSAGDVIRNMYYMSEYLDNIRKYKPRAFILSVGGNDFFEVFPYMLQKGTLDSMDTFLKVSWNTEIKVIELYYKGFLDILTEEFPDLPIILHGYDYIMPRPRGK